VGSHKGHREFSRKLGKKRTKIVAKNEWVKDERTGVKYKRPLAEPKVVDKDFPETRTITISRNAMVKKV
jgi:hypothetical protein